MRAFSGFNMTGLAQTINRVGYFRLAFEAHSWIWLPGRWDGNTRCSVGFCAGDVALGWRGMDETYFGGNTSATRYMDRVVIGCARVFAAPECPSSASVTPQTVPVISPTAMTSVNID